MGFSAPLGVPSETQRFFLTLAQPNLVALSLGRHMAGVSWRTLPDAPLRIGSELIIWNPLSQPLRPDWGSSPRVGSQLMLDLVGAATLLAGEPALAPRAPRRGTVARL